MGLIRHVLTDLDQKRSTVLNVVGLFPRVPQGHPTDVFGFNCESKIRNVGKLVAFASEGKMPSRIRKTSGQDLQKENSRL